MTNIRDSRDEDLEAICHVHAEAFGDEEGPQIVTLVRALLTCRAERPTLSLVAHEETGIVGHVLFTAVQIPEALVPVAAAILAPLAVLPARSRLGIGSALVQEGLSRLSDRDTALVFVLGDPNYYRRHGFGAAGKFGLAAPYPPPEEYADAWMVQELKPGYLGRVKGRLSCVPALSDPKYW